MTPLNRCGWFLKLLILVNSGRESTDGRRARELASRLTKPADVRILYRDDYGRVSAIGAFLREGRRFNPDVVYVELFAYSGLVAGLLLKILTRARLGIGNGDCAFDTHWKAGRHLKALISAGVDWLFRQTADFWVVWSPYYSRWLRSRGARNVACVPGAVLPEQFARRPVAELRRSLGIDGRIVIGIAGNLQYSRKLDMVYGWDLVEALHQLPDLPVCGVVVGGGPGLERLRDMARARGVLDRLKLVGPVPHDSVSQYMSLFDIGLVTLSNDLDARFTWTAKLPEYMAAGVFTITTDVGDDSRRFVQKCGALLPFSGSKDDRYPSLLAATIREILEDRQLLQRREAGPRLAKSLMSYDVAARHFERVLVRACPRP